MTSTASRTSSFAGETISKNLFMGGWPHPFFQLSHNWLIKINGDLRTIFVPAFVLFFFRSSGRSHTFLLEHPSNHRCHRVCFQCKNLVAILKLYHVDRLDTVQTAHKLTITCRAEAQEPTTVRFLL